MTELNKKWRSRIKIRSGLSFFGAASPTFSWRLLIFVLLLAYVPFLGNRVVRPAGDDKVYVAQAVEMAAHGTWFQQTMGGEPNYYKGPLHYIFVRAGMMAFGDSMWATLYMNLILVILGALAIGAIVHRNMREFEGWSFWAGLAFALSAGIYSHMFASQMEVELACGFAIGVYFLDRSGPGKADLKFWLIAGICGWLKSPLHALLLGLGALLFWGWEGTLRPRLKSGGAWLAALLGILLCGLGYLPPYLFDRAAWIDSYLLRETWLKPGNGGAWYAPIIPLFTFSLLPWMLPAFVAYADGISRLWRRQRAIRTTPGARRVMALGFSLMLPTIVFFALHPYRVNNYDLPVVGGLVLLVAAIWATRAPAWSKYYSFAIGLTAALVMGVPVGLTLFTRHFDPMPYWWPSWLLPVIWIGAFFTARGFWREGVTFGMLRPGSLGRRSLWLFMALGFLLTAIGEREMIDLRDRIEAAQKNGETLNLSYYNLQRDTWSEWGYLNFMVPYPTKGLFTEAQLEAAVNNHDLILVPGEEWLDAMKAKLAPKFPNAEYLVEPWRRWKTKGRNARGRTAWQEAWDSRDLSQVERYFYLVRVNPRN